MKQKIFTKKDMLAALERAKEKHPDLEIGATYPILLGYERKGIVDRPPGNWRFYTAEEIRENVSRIVNYKRKAK